MPDAGDTPIDPALEDRPAASRAGLVPALIVIAVVLGATGFATVRALNGGGDRSARQQRFTVRNLPAGEYVVQARIKRADNSERIAETHLVVTGF